MSVLILFIGCSSGSSRNTREEADESSADSDADGDSDGDSDADGDSDGDSDADADSDGDSDADADSDGDSDTDADTDADTDTNYDTDSDPDDENGNDGGADGGDITKLTTLSGFVFRDYELSGRDGIGTLCIFLADKCWSPEETPNVVPGTKIEIKDADFSDKEGSKPKVKFSGAINFKDGTYTMIAYLLDNGGECTKGPEDEDLITYDPSDNDESGCVMGALTVGRNVSDIFPLLNNSRRA